MTGGLEGCVLFTSFQQYKPLTQIINDAIEPAFGRVLERQGLNWLALKDTERLEVARQILRQVPVFWLWDNVEPIAGFPSGTASRWSAKEQESLRDFLREATDTQARFLLTSRRDEQDWLGDLPTRVTLPPMPFLERLRLARALADKQGRRLAEAEDWRPLLDFTRGNPLTITILVNQALRDRLKSKQDIESFVAKLRAGEKAFEDEASEGRTKSLGASLSYGFDNAFDENSRSKIALLYFFQQAVSVDILHDMGDPRNEFCVATIRGLAREAWVELLNRAAETGLLTASGLGLYSIHPAVPWYFKNLFEDFYPSSSADSGEPSPASRAMRAFVESMSRFGRYCWENHQDNPAVIGALALEEPNLLRARELAKSHEWWVTITGPMQGLFTLYEHKGRWAEWEQLVKELKSYFIDEQTEGPISDREPAWRLFMGYGIRLAQEARNWAEAERLQRTLVGWSRRFAAPALVKDPKSLDNREYDYVRSLAVGLNELGLIERETGKPGCVDFFEEAIKISSKIGDSNLESLANLNLGVTCATLKPVLDLERAENCYRRSFSLTHEDNKLWRSKCLSELGFLSLKRGLAALPDSDEANKHMNEALESYRTALSLTPSDALESLSVKHNALGYIYDIAGDVQKSMEHYREAIRCLEKCGKLFDAGKARLGAAKALHNAGLFEDARDYVYAARENFQPFNATEHIQACESLIAEIDQALQNK